MVGHEAHAVAVEDFGRAELAEHVDRNRGGDVVGEDEVEVALNELAGAHLVEAGVGREDLLGYGHGSWHGCLSFLGLF